MRYFLLMLADISQLRSHGLRSDFKSPVVKTGMPSNVSLEKKNGESLCFQIRSETRSRRRQNHGSEPSPSAGTDA
jgi:hypothetical protein